MVDELDRICKSGRRAGAAALASGAPGQASTCSEQLASKRTLSVRMNTTLRPATAGRGVSAGSGGGVRRPGRTCVRLAPAG